MSEQLAGHYSKGFTPEELKQLIGPFRTSPLGLVLKPNADTFQMIQDMSFPCSQPEVASVNNSINPNNFPTEWGTFDATSLMILSLPPGCIAATFNISAAYCLTPICPDQQQHLCVMWEGLIYINRAVMFSLASSAGIFGCVADMLVAIYKAAGLHPLLKWVDDFFMVCLPNQSWSEQDFMDLTEAIGVPWSAKKTHPFSSLQ